MPVPVGGLFVSEDMLRILGICYSLKGRLVGEPHVDGLQPSVIVHFTWGGVGVFLYVSLPFQVVFVHDMTPT